MDEELMARQQPQSLEAEQAVLGSILIDSRCISDIIGILKPEDFYQEQNREIYETVYTPGPGPGGGGYYRDGL